MKWKISIETIAGLETYKHANMGDCGNSLTFRFGLTSTHEHLLSILCEHYLALATRPQKSFCCFRSACETSFNPSFNE